LSTTSELFNPTTVSIESMILYHRDRNWLEFLSVLDATFFYLNPSQNHDSSTPPELAKAECSQHISRTQELFTKLAKDDGQRDRSALLALLELEERARSHGLSTGQFTSIQICFLSNKELFWCFRLIAARYIDGTIFQQNWRQSMLF
jgi:hypothetical protein